MRFRYAIPKGVSLKSYELFLSGIFYLIFSDHSRPRVTDNVKSETVDKGKSLYVLDKGQES